jgi:hypothetical protein
LPGTDVQVEGVISHSQQLCRLGRGEGNLGGWGDCAVTKPGRREPGDDLCSSSRASAPVSQIIQDTYGSKCAIASCAHTFARFDGPARSASSCPETQSDLRGPGRDRLTEAA